MIARGVDAGATPAPASDSPVGSRGGDCPRDARVGSARDTAYAKPPSYLRACMGAPGYCESRDITPRKAQVGSRVITAWLCNDCSVEDYEAWVRDAWDEVELA